MSEGDHDLDAAWRAASVEGLPAALDIAIRAAARREVGAGPRRSRAPRWFPLAAAATVAALAIGIVQLAPRDQVTDTTHISTVSGVRIRGSPGRESRAKAPPNRRQPNRSQRRHLLQHRRGARNRHRLWQPRSLRRQHRSATSRG